MREGTGISAVAICAKIIANTLLGSPNRPTDEALVHHATDGPQVGSVVDLTLPLDLLRAHVRRRSEHRSLTREPLLRRVSVDRRVELCKPEVDDLGKHLPIVALRDEDVLRLEIPGG